MYLCFVVGPLLPPPPARPCPSGSPAFFPWLSHFVALIAAHAHPACAPLLLSVLPLPRCPVPSPPVTPFLPSPPPIRCHSGGPVCTLPSTVTAFAVHSPVCAPRGTHLCPILLSLPFPLVSGRILTLPNLICHRPQAFGYAPLCGLSPLPGRHRFTARGRVNMRTGLQSCLWTG